MTSTVGRDGGAEVFGRNAKDPGVPRECAPAGQGLAAKLVADRLLGDAQAPRQFGLGAALKRGLEEFDERYHIG